MALAADADLRPPPHTNIEVFRPYFSEDMAHFVCLRPWPLTVWPWNWCAI